MATQNVLFVINFLIIIVTIVCGYLVVKVDSETCKDKTSNCGNEFDDNQDKRISIEDVESRVSRLERRLRAMEQPGNLICKYICMYTNICIYVYMYKYIYMWMLFVNSVWKLVWQIRGWPEDWEVCVEGPCKCRPETKSISCWRYGLFDVPAGQLVPQDIIKLYGIFCLFI